MLLINASLGDKKILSADRLDCPDSKQAQQLKRKDVWRCFIRKRGRYMAIVSSQQAAISTTFDRVARNFMNLQKQRDDVSGKTRRRNGYFDVR